MITRLIISYLDRHPVAQSFPSRRARLLAHVAYWVGLILLVRLSTLHLNASDPDQLLPVMLVIGVVGTLASLLMLHMLLMTTPRPSSWFLDHLLWLATTWMNAALAAGAAYGIHGIGHALGSDPDGLLNNAPVYMASALGVWFAYRMVRGYGSYLMRRCPSRCVFPEPDESVTA